MNLKEWLFERRLKKQEKQPVHYLSWEKVRNIIVLYESDIMEKNPFEKGLVKELQTEGKDVTLLGYVPRKDVTSANLPQSRMLGQKDFRWLDGGLKQEVIDDIRKRHYDLLIDMSTRSDLALKYMAMYIRADFKAGKNLGEGIHNMMIDLPQTAGKEELKNELLRYLKMIKG